MKNGFNFFIIASITNIFCTTSKIKFKYPTSITLQNQNIFVVEEKGIHICDPDFTKIIKSVKIFDVEDQISSLEKLSVVNLFRRNTYIISLINYKIYFFDIDGNLLYNSTRLVNDLSPSYLSLTPIGIDSNCIYFILSYFDSNIKLRILYYEYSTINRKISSISNITEDNFKERVCKFFSCSYDQSTYYNFKNQGLSCVYLKDYYYNEYYYLVCFFIFQGTNFEYLGELILNVKTDSLEKSTRYEHEYIEFNNNTKTQIKSNRNSNSDLSLFCLETIYNNSICYKFRLYNNYINFSSNITLQTQCRMGLYATQITYLYETKEIIFSCLLTNEIGGISVSIFDTSLNTKNYTYIKFLGCPNIYGHSVIYSSNTSDYYIISDIDCPGNYKKYFTKLSDLDGIHISESIEEISSQLEETHFQVEEEEKEKEKEKERDSEKEKEKEEKQFSTNIIFTSRIEISSNIICPEQCSNCIEVETKIICTECNNENGYYPLSYSEPPILENCIKEETKQQKYPNFYFDRESGFYRPCYERCKTCNEKGNGKNNNCLSCEEGYILQPDYEYLKNCVSKYKYLYYYNEYDQYSTTETPNCPDNFPIKIQEKNKCVDKCSKDKTFKYTYNNFCFKQCPENTIDDDADLICKDDPTKCVLTQNEKYISNNSNINEEINSLIEKYAIEYNYTENHISLINIGNFSITLYKNKSCVSELSITSKQLDLNGAISKVKNHYNISEKEELIVGIVKNNSGSESFEVYNPHSGKPLNIFDICKDDTYSVEKSLLDEIKANPSVNFDDIQNMADQDINVIDLNHPFYNDICFHYESKFNKDVPLRDRALIYYPNISLCEEGCELEAVYIKNWTAKCNCFFNEEKEGFKDNALYQSQLGEINELLNMVNINVMKCYKDIFKSKFFVKSSGNFIILSLIIANIICTVFYFVKSISNIKKYIVALTEKYLNSLKTHNLQINDITINNNIQESMVKAEEIKNNSPPPKTLNLNNKNNNNIKNNIINNNFGGKNIKNYSRKRGNSVAIPDIFKKREGKFGKLNLATKNIKKEEVLSIVNNNSSSRARMNEKTKTQVNKRISIINLNNENNNISSPNEKIIQEKQEPIEKDEFDIKIEEYLNTDPDDMDYDDALRRDNRKFIQYYWDKIQTNQILINTFYYKEYLKPFPIKLMLLALQIELYLFINGLFYNEEYIKKIFDLKEDTLNKAFLRFTDNLFYAFLVGVIINYIIEFFFIEEKKLRVILKREKDNIPLLKNEMIQIIKDINKRYISFIIICFIISFLIWYHLYCFNNIYPHMQKEWIIFSVLIIVCVQILSFLAILIGTIIRFLSFRFKSEKLFKLSLILS